MAATMIKKSSTIPLIGAPPAMQPGGYVPDAYAKRTEPATAEADLVVERTDAGWTILVRWACPNPVRSTAGETDLFTDAAAIMVPGTDQAHWITMGAPGHPVEACLWRADSDRLLHMHAEGLGTMSRADAPEVWSSESNWENGYWQLQVQLGPWALLDQAGRLGIAIWRGEVQDRGGLKSVSADWISLA